VTVVAVGGIAATFALPWAAVRLARLPVPPVPASAQELQTDSYVGVASRIDFDGRVMASHRYLTWLLAATAASITVAAAILGAGTPFEVVLAGVVAVILALRARTFEWRWPRLITLGGACTAAVFALVAQFTVAGSAERLATVGGLCVIFAAAGVVAGVAQQRPDASWPWVKQVIDVAERALLLVLVPLALLASGAGDLAGITWAM
jgi:hypothetical protein